MDACMHAAVHVQSVQSFIDSLIHSVAQSLSHSVARSLTQSAIQPASQAVSQTVIRSLARSLVCAQLCTQAPDEMNSSHSWKHPRTKLPQASRFRLEVSCLLGVLGFGPVLLFGGCASVEFRASGFRVQGL